MSKPSLIQTVVNYLWAIYQYLKPTKNRNCRKQPPRQTDTRLEDDNLQDDLFKKLVEEQIRQGNLPEDDRVVKIDYHPLRENYSFDTENGRIFYISRENFESPIKEKTWRKDNL